ncbi:MAG TPA: serine/threonine-protein kinase, partial [Methanomicrobiales archaeon]|nr:serine/threonine-protein kinase [Methanomicrobiales archaeon]
TTQASLLAQNGGPSGPGNQLSFSRSGILIVLGIILSTVVVVSDLREGARLPSGFMRREIYTTLYVALALVFAGELYTVSLPEQGWALLLPVLGVSLVCSSAGLGFGFMGRYRFSRTLWFQAGISAAMAILLPFSLYSSDGSGDVAILAGIPFVLSALLAFWNLSHTPRTEREEPPEQRDGMATRIEPRGENDSAAFAAFGDAYMDVVPIAVGGLARVYRAKRKRDGAVVAIKVPLNTDASTGACFMREMLAWKDLVHPNIVHIIGANILPSPAVEMEYIGTSLADIKKPMAVGEAVRLIEGIAEGLAYAHSRGVIHRDIKPENILLTEDGVPKITDWGMSRIIAACHLPTVVGFSPSYAAPEQVSTTRYGETDPRTDIFQLGVVFYELVTGRLPFPGEGILEITQAILNQDPVRPSELVPESIVVEPIILRCLEKEPAKRYQSAEELLEALHRVEGDLAAGSEKAR